MHNKGDSPFTIKVKIHKKRASSQRKYLAQYRLDEKGKKEGRTYKEAL